MLDEGYRVIWSGGDVESAGHQLCRELQVGCFVIRRLTDKVCAIAEKEERQSSAHGELRQLRESSFSIVNFGMSGCKCVVLLGLLYRLCWFSCPTVFLLLSDQSRDRK